MRAQGQPSRWTLRSCPRAPGQVIVIIPASYSPRFCICVARQLETRRWAPFSPGEAEAHRMDFPAEPSSVGPWLTPPRPSLNMLTRCRQSLCSWLSAGRMPSPACAPSEGPRDPNILSQVGNQAVLFSWGRGATTSRPHRGRALCQGTEPGVRRAGLRSRPVTPSKSFPVPS